MRDLLQGVFVFVVTVFAMIGCTSVFFHGGGKTSEPAPTLPASQAQPSKPSQPSTPPAPVVAPTPTPVAAVDPKVMGLQALLNGAGQNVPMNGHMDAVTKNAVIAFQKQHGLTPDGVVGSRTEQALQRANASYGKAPADTGLRRGPQQTASDPGSPPPASSGCESVRNYVLQITASQRDVLTDIKCGDYMVDIIVDDDAWMNTSHYVRQGMYDKMHRAFGMPVEFVGSFSHEPLDVRGGAR
jgi:hypothetical protein